MSKISAHTKQKKRKEKKRSQQNKHTPDVYARNHDVKPYIMTTN